MPFTFSHPAAVLPLRRWCPRWLDFPALIIGSMMPDLGYFIGDNVLSDMAHEVRGLAVPCVIIGWLCYLLFATAWPGWVALLPEPHRGGLQRGWAPLQWSGGQFARITLALYLGAWSHVLWDSATHVQGWLVVALPALQSAWHGFPVYSWLQHGSTVCGGVCLVLAYRRWLQRQGIAWIARWEWRWCLWGAIALMSAAWGGRHVEDGMRHGLDGALVNWVIQTVLLFLVISLLLAVGGRWLLRRKI